VNALDQLDSQIFLEDWGRAMSAGLPFEPKRSNAQAVDATRALQRVETVAVAELSLDGSATHDSLLAYVLEAAERLAVAWTVLCKDASRHSQALAARRDRAGRVIDQLQRLVSHARETLAPPTLSTQARPAAESSTESRSRSTPDRAANDERVPGAAIGGFDGGHPASNAPSLVAYCLGAFQVLADDTPIDVWPNSKSKAVLKYLLLNRQAPVAKEVLMDLFWPEVDPEAARNSLNVSIHRLRRALSRASPTFPFIVFREGCYGLNPKLRIWTDVDAFSAHLQRARALEAAGCHQEALDAYAACAALYNAELLAEDRYDDWLSALRQQLRDGYLAALHRLREHQFSEHDYSACMTSCAKILSVDTCDEKAHQTLMRCYAQLGQPQLAQRQYQLCVQSLARELAIVPSGETTELYRQIVRRQEI
jgi:DNA-binding SARP family transcriptional activator